MRRHPFQRQTAPAGAQDPAAAPEELPQSPEGSDDKKAYGYDEDKVPPKIVEPADVTTQPYDEEGRWVAGEKVIETSSDVATRLISLEDDPSEPVFTFRMWFLGLGMTCFAAILGQIYYFRPQTVYVSQLFIQIIAFMIGKAMAKVMPNWSHKGGVLWWLNPGDFNIKEHACIVIMSSTATSSAMAISVFASDDLFYNINVSYANGFFALLASQTFGYALAGFMRSFLVYPTYIVFPSLLPTVNLFDALHRDKDVLQQRKRVRFFWIIFCVIFVWEFFPEFIAPTLTGVSIFCLAKRDSRWFTRIFGGSNGNEGLGMFALCFDWNYVGSGGGSLGALFTPFTTQISYYIGIGICCITFSAAYANNVWHAQNFPFLSQELFLLNGSNYDQAQILNEDYSVNTTKLEQYGLPWFATSNAIYLLGDNLAVGATITHVLVWHGRDMLNAFREYLSGGQTDPHYQKMRAYKEAPMWWYGIALVVSFIAGMTTIYTGHAHLSWWQFIVALLLSALLFPLFTTVYATTGFSTDTQQLAQMLGAAIAPHSPQANQWFTLYGANTMTQARALIRDLKLGQYTKVPPRATFVCQVVGTILGAVLQLVMMKQIVSAHRDILLSVEGTNIWSGQQVQSWNSNAVSWSIAKEMFPPSREYFVIPFAIVIGLFVPLPFWLIHQRWPKLRASAVITPILCWTIGNLSVGINSSIMTTMLLAIVSQYYLRKFRPVWFRKYNYLLSAALDGGTQFMVFIASFALFGASGSPKTMPTWALNPDPKKYNLDYCALAS